MFLSAYYDIWRLFCYLSGCFDGKVGEMQPEGISAKDGDIILGDYYGSNREALQWNLGIKEQVKRD